MKGEARFLKNVDANCGKKNKLFVSNKKEPKTMLADGVFNVRHKARHRGETTRPKVKDRAM